MQGPLPPRWGCCGCQRPIRVCGLQPVFDALGYSWHANCVPSGWSRRVETVDLTDGDSSAVSSWEAAVAASSEEAAVAASEEAAVAASDGEVAVAGSSAAEAAGGDAAEAEGAGAAEAAAVSWPPVVASLATWHKHSRRWLSDRSRSR